MTLAIINAQQVRELMPMAACIDVMAEAMAAASAGAVAVPPRNFVPLMGEGAFLGMMPGSSLDLGYYGAKVISLQRENPARGLPLVQGFVVLFDNASGAPVALVEGAEVTALRTAAASGLATRLLAREDARSCGIFGNGVQAVSHIDAVCATRPIEEIRVWGRDAGKVRSFAAAQSQRTGLPVHAVDDPAEAGACDVICTVTGTSEPVLLGEWVQPGAHVNLVGCHTLDTREADSDLVAAAAVYVDLRESNANEGGDVMIPLREGRFGEEHILGELGELVAGSVPGRRDAAQVTLYNSLGMTAQDLYAARYIYQQAQQRGVGERVAF